MHTARESMPRLLVLLALALVVLVTEVQPASATPVNCSSTSYEQSIFSYSTDASAPGYAYPVNGMQGQLNTTWLHTMDTAYCTTATVGTAETSGILYNYVAGTPKDFIEIGDYKGYGYTTANPACSPRCYGKVFVEYRINGVLTGPTLSSQIDNAFATFMVRTSGTYNTSAVAAWDSLGGIPNTVVANVSGFRDDRGIGWAESSRRGPLTVASTSIANMQQRCPCNGLWAARAATTNPYACYDNISNYDLQPAALNETRVLDLTQMSACMP
jgi:hypothetical protein